MTNTNKSTLFHLKVRNQVLKNNNHKIGYTLKYYILEIMLHSDYTFLNDFCTDIRKKNERLGRCNWIPEFIGPREYSWGKNIKYCFFYHKEYKYWNPIIVLPRDWLLRYDPTIPIILELCYTIYLDLGNQEWDYLISYLVRERFHLEYELRFIEKSDEDWCITHLDTRTTHRHRIIFKSFLLFKNMDFSEFDLQVETRGLECPLYYSKGVKIKKKPQFQIRPFSNSYWNCRCICVDCRKDYRVMVVDVYPHDNSVDLIPLYLLRRRTN